MRKTAGMLMLSCCALALAIPSAEAAPRRAAAKARPLIIQHRSFLDSGKIVAVGSQPGWMTTSNTASSYIGWNVGMTNLPGPNFMPGRPVNLMTVTDRD